MTTATTARRQRTVEPVAYSISADRTYRALVRAWRAGECPLGIVDDYREDKGLPRIEGRRAPVEAVDLRGGRYRSMLSVVYDARRERRVNPEGHFDSKGRWYPSDREDGDGDGTSVHCPTKAWPYSYMLRCRTRQHCAVLVRRALLGYDVPDDVRRRL